jgi:hypothetical protein
MKRLAMILGMFTLLLVSLSNAQQRWERTYGGAGNDYGYSVQQTSDTGYIVAGQGESFGDTAQVYLIKTNASGDTLWTRTYGGAGYDYGYSVQQTQDGGYIVAGTTGSVGNDGQFYLIKTNASGDTLWTRNYGGMALDKGRSVQQTTDGGYIITGETYSFGNLYQVYLIKTNASGDTLWTRTYGGASYDGGLSVQQTQDSGYIVAGYTASYGNSFQVYLIKTNSLGDTLWTKTYGGLGDDYGLSVQQTTDGGYIAAGATNSFGNGNQVYLVKTNASGDTLWTRTYGGANSEEGYSVRQTTDGGYIVSGYTNSFGNGYQVNLIKTNEGGDSLWTGTYGGASDDRGFSVHQASDRGYIVAGVTRSFGNGWQVYLIKTDSLGRSSGVEETAEVRGQRSEVRITAKPNPFTSFATVPGHEGERFALYDIAGRLVGNYKGDRVGEGLGPGVYFLRSSDINDKPLRIVKVR